MNKQLRPPPRGTGHEWLRTAKQHLKERVAYRLQERLQYMEHVINDSLPSNICRMTIEESIRYQIFEEAKTAIEGYQGTRNFQRNLETSQKSVIAQSRTWWNRTKSHKLGGSLFAVICFYLLYNFLSSHCMLSEREQLILFIDIFRKLLTTSIKFHRTKPKPLILQQCFLHGESFKAICMDFVNVFGDETIKWEAREIRGLRLENGRAVYKYIKDKNRSEALQGSFLKCMRKIKQKLLKCDDNDAWLKNSLKRWRIKVNRLKPRNYDVVFLKPSDAGYISKNNNHNIEEKKIECKQNDAAISHNSNYNVQDSEEQDLIIKNVENDTIRDGAEKKSTNRNIYVFKHNKHRTKELILNDIIPIEDDYTKCKKIKIPEECKCKCIECKTSLRYMLHEFDYRQYQAMNNFGCAGNRIHRTYNEVTQDIYNTSERTMRLLEHLRSLWSFEKNVQNK